jgi:hypothetical protein
VSAYSPAPLYDHLRGSLCRLWAISAFPTCVRFVLGWLDTAIDKTEARMASQGLTTRVSSRSPQGDGATHGIDATLVRAVCRPGVPGYIIASEKQLREAFVLGRFKFPEQ